MVRQKTLFDHANDLSAVAIDDDFALADDGSEFAALRSLTTPSLSLMEKPGSCMGTRRAGKSG